MNRRVPEQIRETKGTRAELDRLETELAKLQAAARLGTDLQAEATTRALEADPLEAEANELLDRAAGHHQAAEAAVDRADAAAERVREAARWIAVLNRPGPCAACDQGIPEGHRDERLRSLREAYIDATAERDMATATAHQKEGEAADLRARAESRNRRAAELRVRVVELHAGVQRSQAAADSIPGVIAEIERRRGRLAELEGASR
jgi:hypothetical protein